MQSSVEFWLIGGVFVALIWVVARTKKGDEKVCTVCGHYGPTRVHTPGSIVIELVLWPLFIVPGLVYSIWRMSARKLVCSECGSQTVVPADSPVGRKLMSDAGRKRD